MSSYLEKMQREQALAMSQFDRAKVQLRLNEVLDLARNKFGVKLQMQPTSYKLKGRAAAQMMCQYHTGSKRWVFQMRINREAYHMRPEEMLESTIPHEIAHAVCHENGTDKGHGHRWQMTDLALGGDGSRTHDMKLTSVRKQKKFLYVNENGDEVNFKQGRHSNLQLGKTHYYETKTGKRWIKSDFKGEV